MVKPSPVSSRVPKTFSIQPWTGAGEGEKIVMYGKSGNGKSTLAATAPNPVFIGLDDGGRKILNPVTGKPVDAVQGVETFDDVRDALHQSSLFPKGTTCVIDTFTKLEAICEPYIFANYKQNGQTVTSMRKYGWDGPAHVLETMRLVLSDLDALVRRGVNVLLLCQLAQIRVANAEGADYLEDGPKLQHNNQYSVRTEVCEWADHVIRVGYANFDVQKDNANAKVGKVQQGDGIRAIFTGGAQHFIAKSRPIGGNRMPAVVSFNEPADRSLWQFVFEGAVVA